MGCGDSKSSSGQTPRQPQQQPNKFDRVSIRMKYNVFTSI